MLRLLGLLFFLGISVASGQEPPNSTQPLTHEQMENNDRFEWRTIGLTEPLPPDRSIARVRQAIEGRTSLLLHPRQQWIPFQPKLFRQYPFLHIEMCGTPPSLSIEDKLAFRDFFNAGGTLFFDFCRQNKEIEAWKRWGESIFSDTEWEPLTSAHVIAFSFYLLEKRMLLNRGNTFMNVLSNDDRFIMVMNQNPQFSWNLFQQTRISSGLNSHQNEIRLRFYINLMMYVLTGNYKSDQLHLPTILLRRK